MVDPSSPRPFTRLNTPACSPAACIPAMIIALTGVTSEGFNPLQEERGRPLHQFDSLPIPRRNATHNSDGFLD